MLDIYMCFVVVICLLYTVHISIYPKWYSSSYVADNCRCLSVRAFSLPCHCVRFSIFISCSCSSLAPVSIAKYWMRTHRTLHTQTHIHTNTNAHKFPPRPHHLASTHPKLLCWSVVSNHVSMARYVVTCTDETHSLTLTLTHTFAHNAHKSICVDRERHAAGAAGAVWWCCQLELRYVCHQWLLCISSRYRIFRACWSVYATIREHRQTNRQTDRKRANENKYDLFLMWYWVNIHSIVKSRD